MIKLQWHHSSQVLEDYSGNAGGMVKKILEVLKYLRAGLSIGQTALCSSIPNKTIRIWIDKYNKNHGWLESLCYPKISPEEKTKLFLKLFYSNNEGKLEILWKWINGEKVDVKSNKIYLFLQDYRKYLK